MAPTLKPFQRMKDGRGALLSIRNQYAGKDKWEAELRKQEEMIHNRLWKGQGRYTLEKFVALHRNAFVQMQLCAQHVEYQLPLEYTRVTYFLNALKCPDPVLQAAIAQVKADERNKDGKRYNFEDMAAYLLPSDPVATKVSETKSRDASVGDVKARTNNFGEKKGIGKSGVHFRYYKSDEYRKLSTEQKAELNEWRAKNGGSKSERGKDAHKAGGGKGKFRGQNSQKRGMSFGNSKSEKSDEDIDKMIMSLQASPSEEKSPQKPKISDVTQVNTSALKSILR